MKNVLSGVPRSETAEVGSDLKQIFKVSRKSSALVLAKEFVERYEKKYIKAIEVFKRRIEDALCDMKFPNSHRNFIRTTNGKEGIHKQETKPLMHWLRISNNCL
jgi:transposase-like protein